MPVEWQAGRAQVGVLGGVDGRADRGLAATSEVYAGGWASRDTAALSAWAGGRFDVQALPGQELAWLDGGAVELGVAKAHPLTPGVGLQARGGLLATPWYALGLGPRLATGVGRSWLAAGVVGGGRGDGSVFVPAAGAWARAGRSVGPIEVGLDAAGDRYFGEVAPGQVRGEVWAWTARGAWSTNAWSGIRWTAGTEQVHAAGLSPGALEVTGGAGLSRRIARGIAVRAEVDGALGMAGTDYRAGRALVGLEVRRGAVRSSDAVTPDVLAIDAPSDAQVQVTGSFSGWAPLPLEYRDGRWVLDLQLASGTYEYVYLIDGKIVVPDGATRPDGFGGNNGVLVIP